MNQTDRKNLLRTIREKTDLVALVRESVHLEELPGNGTHVGVCPLCGATLLFVVPAKQVWHCFCCGKGGDALAWATMVLGLGFSDAVVALAKRAGVSTVGYP